MKRKRSCLVITVTVLVGAVLAGKGGATDLAIRSFDHAGRLSFNRLPTATVYRVEWTATPGGPWTNFSGAAGALNAIEQFAAGSYTCSVPMTLPTMFCRVTVATNTFLVVDLSGGPTATNYPITCLANPPPGGWTDACKTTNLVLRRIPAGTFMMGSPAAEPGHATGGQYEVLHQVTLTKDFYIGVFEVTQKQWERVTGKWPSYYNNTAYRDTRPVEYITWYQTREDPDASTPAVSWPSNSVVYSNSFIGRLRAKTGLDALDLPTEAQWEYACRAGTTNGLNSGREISLGGACPYVNELGRYLWNGGNNSHVSNLSPARGTAGVGLSLPNAWGLYDMHGNVWEWCLDRFGDYPGTVTDPKGAETGLIRVMRGGCLTSGPEFCRSAYRNNSIGPGVGQYYVGLRVTYTPP